MWQMGLGNKPVTPGPKSLVSRIRAAFTMIVQRPEQMVQIQPLVQIRALKHILHLIQQLTRQVQSLHVLITVINGIKPKYLRDYRYRERLPSSALRMNKPRPPLDDLCNQLSELNLSETHANLPL